MLIFEWVEVCYDMDRPFPALALRQRLTGLITNLFADVLPLKHQFDGFAHELVALTLQHLPQAAAQMESYRDLTHTLRLLLRLTLSPAVEAFHCEGALLAVFKVPRLELERFNQWLGFLLDLPQDSVVASASISRAADACIHVGTPGCRPVEDSSEPNDERLWAQRMCRNAKLEATPATETDSPLIAVIDTGIEQRHPLLQRYLAWDIINAQTGQLDFTNPDATFPEDENGHGTRVASLLIGQSPGEPPVRIGVAPGARLLPIKITVGTKTFTSAQIAKGICLAAELGADLIVCSATTKVNSCAVSRAVDFATQRKHCMVFCSSGDDGKDPQAVTLYPAGYNRMLLYSVGGFDKAGEITEETNRHSSLDLLAPGADVLVANRLGIKKEVCYEPQRGTSFSAPLAAGVAGLIWQHTPGKREDKHKRIRKALSGSLLEMKPITGLTRLPMLMIEEADL